MNRYVLYSEEWGVYLGSFLGLGFWSKIDPVGQDGACTFENEEQIRDWIATWDGGPPPDWRAVAVPDVGYASIEQCVVAGLPAWTP